MLSSNVIGTERTFSPREAVNLAVKPREMHSTYVYNAF